MNDYDTSVWRQVCLLFRYHPVYRFLGIVSVLALLFTIGFSLLI